MTQVNGGARFEAKIHSPVLANDDENWAFVVLPKNISATLPRRGRTTVDACIKGQVLQITLEPDGQLSHWLRLDADLLKTCDAKVGDWLEIAIKALEQEPEPLLPNDLIDALTQSPAAQATWDKTTTIARIDWIHWISSAKQSKTRIKRIHNACDMLQAGKRRVCCFDPSGFYSKALSAPKAKDF